MLIGQKSLAHAQIRTLFHIVGWRFHGFKLVHHNVTWWYISTFSQISAVSQITTHIQWSIKNHFFIKAHGWISIHVKKRENWEMNLGKKGILIQNKKWAILWKKIEITQG